MYLNFDTPESALDYLFEKAERSILKSGYVHIFHHHKSLGGGGVAGARGTKRSDLIGRVYTINWCNDSVSIDFLDEIFMEEITGRSYPEKTRCCLVRYPTNEILD